MIFGLFSGIFWALDTIVLSYISEFVLIICFFHDFIAVWLLFFTSKINLKKQELKTSAARYSRSYGNFKIKKWW